MGASDLMETKLNLPWLIDYLSGQIAKAEEDGHHRTTFVDTHSLKQVVAFLVALEDRARS